MLHERLVSDEELSSMVIDAKLIEDYSSDEKIAANANVDVGIIRKVIKWRDAPLGGRKPIRSDSRTRLTEFMARIAPDLGVVRHQKRWSGRVFGDVSITKQNLLQRHVRASTFRQGLRDAFQDTSLGYPREALFVSTTGQWVRPVLRKLLALPVQVTVLICHPASLKGSGGNVAQTLSVLEFLWSMPVSLDLQADWPSTLIVKTYNGSVERDRLAYFPGELIARSRPSEVLQRKHLRGHPGYDGGQHLRGLVQQSVDVHYWGHPNFEQQSQRMLREIEGIPEVQPCLTWTNTGFDLNPEFDMNPASYRS